MIVVSSWERHATMKRACFGVPRPTQKSVGRARRTCTIGSARLGRGERPARRSGVAGYTESRAAGQEASATPRSPP